MLEAGKIFSYFGLIKHGFLCTHSVKSRGYLLKEKKNHTEPIYLLLSEPAPKYFICDFQPIPNCASKEQKSTGSADEVLDWKHLTADTFQGTGCTKPNNYFTGCKRQKLGCLVDVFFSSA